MEKESMLTAVLLLIIGGLLAHILAKDRSSQESLRTSREALRSVLSPTIEKLETGDFDKNILCSDYPLHEKAMRDFVTKISYWKRLSFDSKWHDYKRYYEAVKNNAPLVTVIDAYDEIADTEIKTNNSEVLKHLKNIYDFVM